MITFFFFRLCGERSRYKSQWVLGVWDPLVFKIQEKFMTVELININLLKRKVQTFWLFLYFL